MANLLPILFPKVRAEVLRLLFADASAELHLRDLARRSGLALGTVQTELAKLSAAQLVVAERDGNRLYYRANAAHPLFPTLCQLVRQTTGTPARQPPAALPPSTAPATSNRSTRPTNVSPATVLPATSANPPPPASLTLNEFD
jgi:DNA-binding transcriptional ArsR family regulator